MDSDLSNCAVNIMRENKTAYSARKFRVIVNGKETVLLKNGETVRILLPQGQQNISFAIGGKVFKSVCLDLKGNIRDINLVCFPKSMGGIDVKSTVVDLSQQKPQKEKTSFGLRLMVAIPIIILVFILVHSCISNYLG